jgi:hypothetical protein
MLASDESGSGATVVDRPRAQNIVTCSLTTASNYSALNKYIYISTLVITRHHSLQGRGFSIFYIYIGAFVVYPSCSTHIGLEEWKATTQHIKLR